MSSKGRNSDFFQDYYDYSERTNFWAFLGTKLACFSFSHNLMIKCF